MLLAFPVSGQNGLREREDRGDRSSYRLAGESVPCPVTEHHVKTRGKPAEKGHKTPCKPAAIGHAARPVVAPVACRRTPGEGRRACRPFVLMHSPAQLLWEKIGALPLPQNPNHAPTPIHLPPAKITSCRKNPDFWTLWFLGLPFGSRPLLENGAVAQVN